MIATLLPHTENAVSLLFEGVNGIQEIFYKMH